MRNIFFHHLILFTLISVGGILINDWIYAYTGIDSHLGFIMFFAGPVLALFFYRRRIGYHITYIQSFALSPSIMLLAFILIYGYRITLGNYSVGQPGYEVKEMLAGFFFILFLNVFIALFFMHSYEDPKEGDSKKDVLDQEEK